MINILPHNKMLDWSKFKVLADNKLNVDKMTISLFDRVENTVVKGENAGYQIFSISHSVYQSFLQGC